jgi:anti-sigma factor RsiW
VSCQDTRDLLDAYFDGELDPVRSVEVDDHLQACLECRSIQTQLKAMRTALQRPGIYFKPPEGLEARIRTSVGVDKRESFPWWQWAAVAAGVAAVFLSLWLSIRAIQRPTADNGIAREVVSGHVRSLMADHLTDVPSSDQHTVKPWFNGKLDFAPVVKDLADSGFPLIGGRLDYLNERPVAALLYKRNRHPINLFEWPASAVQQPRAATMKGFNLIHWEESGMTFWAISDLNAHELNQFVEHLRD